MRCSTYHGFHILSQAVTYVYNALLQHTQNIGSLTISDQDRQLLQYILWAPCTKWIMLVHKKERFAVTVEMRCRSMSVNGIKIYRTTNDTQVRKIKLQFLSGIRQGT
jgi:hypothetical protein